MRPVGRSTSAPDEVGRRGLIAAGGGLVLTIATTGCLDWLDDQLTFEASPATVSDGTLEDTGYEHVETRAVEVAKTFEAGGQSQDVTTVNQIAEYDKRVELSIGSQRAAVFAVLATPQVEVLDETFNPVGDMSTRELAEMVQQQYEEFEDLEHASDGTVEVLGTETTRSRFVGEAQLRAGARVDLDVHLTEAVASGEDFVVCIGAFPSAISGELEDVETMMRGLAHGG